MLAARGRLEEAAESLRTALRQAPGIAGAAEALERVEESLGDATGPQV